ncbi:MAG: PKD domain-containing protein [Bacteroidota bacterium]
MKNFTNTAFILVLIGAFFMACEETPLPEEMQGDVVFYAEGSIGEKDLKIEAGIDDYYMASSHKKNDRGLILFQGEFDRPSCSDCGEKLLIEISNNKILGDGEAVDIDTALAEKEYAFSSQTSVSDIYVVDFQAENSGSSPIDSSNWDFGDGSSSNDINPQHEYIDPRIRTPEVCFRSVDADGCVSIICNRIVLDSSTCKVDFDYELNGNTGFINFFDKSEGQFPLEHRWDFGDGFGASLGNPGYYFGNDDNFNVCLTVTDATGCRRSLCKNISLDPTTCNTNFTYNISQLSGPGSVQFSRVRIQWIDEAGKVYSSDLRNQGAATYFRILHSEKYEDNERGEKTQKLDVEAKCTLWTEDGSESIELDVTEAVIAVAYP